ncbi:restriction endonuclease subunit S [Pseudonocardia saturnea]
MSPAGGAHLGDVAEFVRGITFKPDDIVPAGTAGSIPCMRTKNVQAKIDLSDVWSVDARFVRRADQYLRPGDLLVSSANSWKLVGKCCWVPEEATGSTFGGFISALRPNREFVEPRYFFHWFSSAHVQATVRSFGRQTTNISNLDFARCLTLAIPLPPLAEQQRIAMILDAADALRTKRRQTMALLDDLTKSDFLQTFGDPESNPKCWPRRHLRDVLQIPLRNGLSPSTAGAATAKVLTLAAVTGQRFNASAVKVASFKVRPPESQSVKASDFLICRGNGNVNLVGRGVFASADMPDTTFPDTVIAAQPQPSQVLAEYLFNVWRSRHIRGQIESAARTTNGTFKINQAALEMIEFPVPPLNLQATFANRTQRIAKLLKSHEDHLLELDALFASIQRHAFGGTLWDSAAA